MKKINEQVVNLTTEEKAILSEFNVEQMEQRLELKPWLKPHDPDKGGDGNYTTINFLY